MVGSAVLIAIFLCTACAEWLHVRRCRKLGALLFPGEGRGRRWTRVVPAVRVLACVALCWGLLYLLAHMPQSTSEETLSSKPDPRKSMHLVLVWDASPSMDIKDAGTSGSQERKVRAREVVESVLKRIARSDVLYSLVAFYTDARPVVVASMDPGVVTNIMELPMEQAFSHGKTKLLRGLEVAFTMAEQQKWAPKSTVFLVITDGDTVESDEKELPTPPKCMRDLIVAGVGTRHGEFIDGHQSVQNYNTLRFMAARFAGSYQNVNVKHISTKTMGTLAGAEDEDEDAAVDMRRRAVICCICGTALLALLPLLLEIFGFRSAAARGAKQQLRKRST